MPIDPKKFKRIVTNHFDNLTKEYFLKTLDKSSSNFIEYVNFKLEGKGSDFLVDFLDSIDPDTLRIDCNKLNNNANSTFVDGFSILTEALQSRQWINLISKGEYIVSEQHYQTLVNWLTQEIIMQYEEENLNNSKTFANSTRNIEIPISMSIVTP
jgi:hypothetical protein